MDDEFVLSPLAVASRGREEGTITILGGGGLDRQRVDIACGPAGEALLGWLLARAAPGSEPDLVSSLVAELGVAEADAGSIVDELLRGHVLIARDAAETLDSAIAPWAEHGWDDAAVFHRSTFGQRFDPDTLNDVSYEEYYRWLGRTSQQPEPFGPVPAPGVDTPPPAAATSGLSEVLARSAPINRFSGGRITVDRLLGTLCDAFQARRSIRGQLGEHLVKTYPSGGARHPLELSVVAKSVAGLAPGTYRFDAVGGGLHPAAVDGNAVDGIDRACFGKGGIVTADAVLLLTVRWGRHNWKYRYSRSYRMVLLEVGHAVQALHLAALDHGADAYHCPSIDGHRADAPARARR